MSLQVNFTTHGRELKAAYDAILRPADPKSGDNWAIFGYDKGSNDLKVLGQGAGGLEELEDEFVDGKIQYAFVRIIDPNSQLNKFILIAWVRNCPVCCMREKEKKSGVERKRDRRRLWLSWATWNIQGHT